MSDLPTAIPAIETRPTVAPEALTAQVQHILDSPLLKGSEPLRKLLLVFRDHALQHPGEPLKEYTVATLALARTSDYDPRVDATVRVQVGRLRAKMAEYYTGEGAADPVYLEIPRGSYLLAASLRAQADSAPAPAASRRWRLNWIYVLSAALALVLAAWFLSWYAHRPPAPLRIFWAHFVRGSSGPVVIFSNPKFVGNPNEGLRVPKPGERPAGPFDETYTGVGEVFATHAVADTFYRFGLHIRPKTAQLFTWDDAKTNDLVVLGSPWQNQPAADLPRLKHILFKDASQEPFLGKGGVWNAQPHPGEQQFYRRSWDGANSTDYAIIAYLPGVVAGRRLLYLQGITTASTQAAAEFVGKPDQLSDLLRRLPLSGSELPCFEALIRVDVRRGVPVDSDVLLTRLR
jgi:hypothetical protein